MLISSMALMFSFVLPDISNGVREVSDFNECRCRTSQQLELKFTVSGVHCRQDNQRDFLFPHTENKQRLKEEDGNYGDKSFIRFHASPYRAKSGKKKCSSAAREIFSTMQEKLRINLSFLPYLRYLLSYRDRIAFFQSHAH